MSRKNKKEEFIDDKALPIPMIGKELGRFEGVNFYIAEHEYAALFHVYNSMDLIIRKAHNNASDGLLDIVRNKDLYQSLEGEDRENVDTFLSMLGLVLTAPLLALPARKDGLFTKIYDCVSEYIIALEERLSKEKPKEDNVEENIKMEKDINESELLIKELDKTMK